MKLKKKILLALAACISVTGMMQAVTKRYFDPRILNIEGMLNGTKAMNYGIAKRDLEELRISLKNEPKNSDRYKRFLKAEARLNAFAPARSAAAPAASQAVVPLSSAEESEALAAAEAADQDGQGAMVVANDYAGSGVQGSMAGYMDLKHRADAGTTSSGNAVSDDAMVVVGGNAGSGAQGSTAGYMDLKGKTTRTSSNDTMETAGGSAGSAGSSGEQSASGSRDLKHSADAQVHGSTSDSAGTLVPTSGSTGAGSHSSTTGYMDIKSQTKAEADARLAAGDIAEIKAAIERIRDLGQEQKNITKDRTLMKKQMDKFLQSAQALLNGINNQALLTELAQLKERIANPQQWHAWINDGSEIAKDADWKAVKKFIKKVRNAATKFIQVPGGPVLNEDDEKNSE